MSLNDKQLFEILNNQGITEVQDIIRKEHIVRDRASLIKIDIHMKDNRILSLIEKSTISKSVPYENNMYSYYSNKGVSIPKIFYNEYDQMGQVGILLMEDLSLTNCNISDWNVPIDPIKRTALIEVISQFHAVSWGKQEFPVPRHST